MIRHDARTNGWARWLALSLLALLVACEGGDGGPGGGATGDGGGGPADVAASDGGETPDVAPEDGGGGTPDATPDAGGGPADAGGGDDAASDDDVIDPPAEDGREIIAWSHNRSCVGCDHVSWCGMPPKSDLQVITLDAAPNAQTGVFFAAERWEAAGRALPLDTCDAIVGDRLPSVMAPLDGIDVVDAGDITVAMDMAGWDAPLRVDYKRVTHTYVSVAAPVRDGRTYEPGATMSLAAAGGEDVAAFAATHPAPERIELLAPHTDEQGQIANIATEGALDVAWEAEGAPGSLVLVLQSYWCPWDVVTMVLCHVANDGAFTVPAETMAAIEWANAVELSLYGSRRVALPDAALPDRPAWTVRVWANLPVYHDPAAERPYPPADCTSEVLPEGFAGAPCASDADCGGGCCLTPVQAYFDGGYCTLVGCESDADCPADAACVTNPHPQVPIATFCGQRCENHGDCREPLYACLEMDGAAVCRPNLW